MEEATDDVTLNIYQLEPDDETIQQHSAAVGFFTRILTPMGMGAYHTSLTVRYVSSVYKVCIHAHEMTCKMIFVKLMIVLNVRRQHYFNSRWRFNINTNTNFQHKSHLLIRSRSRHSQNTTHTRTDTTRSHLSLLHLPRIRLKCHQCQHFSNHFKTTYLLSRYILSFTQSELQSLYGNICIVFVTFRSGFMFG